MAAGGADGDEAELQAPPSELVQQLHGHAGAGGAERVPEGERAAVDVQPVEVDDADGFASAKLLAGEPADWRTP